MKQKIKFYKIFDQLEGRFRFVEGEAPADENVEVG
jgi:hypothetical protein